MITEKTLQSLRDWSDQYETNVLPLREDADNNNGSYEPYDDAYNQHLEHLHELVGAILADNPGKPKGTPVYDTICRFCGSNNISIDARAAWDVNGGEWYLAAHYDDNAECGNCGTETLYNMTQIGETE